ncbi:hypothetical protein [Bradyrhizobium diazoefficiens]
MSRRYTGELAKPIAEQEVHELGPRKTKAGIKLSRRGTKSDPPRGMKIIKNDLTVL